MNPYLGSLDLTPYIPDLPGGAELFGIWGRDGCSMAMFRAICASQPSNAVAALVRMDSLPGLDFGPGFDALFYLSLSHSVLSDTQMGVGNSDLHSLRIGGAARDVEFGGSGAADIAALYAGDVWVTLIASDATQFNLAASKGHVWGSASAATLALGSALFLSVPEPASAWIVGSALLALALRRRRPAPALR